MSILYYLMKTPTAMSKLRAEIEETEKREDMGHVMKYAVSQKMPYLQVIVKEALRVHPSVSFILPRHVPDSGATISGKYLPAGVRIIYSSILLFSIKKKRKAWEETRNED
jgi:cytochrome P450